MGITGAISNFTITSWLKTGDSIAKPCMVVSQNKGDCMHKIGEPQYRPQNSIFLTMGTPNRYP